MPCELLSPLSPREFHPITASSSCEFANLTHDYRGGADGLAKHQIRTTLSSQGCASQYQRNWSWHAGLDGDLSCHIHPPASPTKAIPATSPTDAATSAPNICQASSPNATAGQLDPNHCPNSSDGWASSSSAVAQVTQEFIRALASQVELLTHPSPSALSPTLPPTPVPTEQQFGSTLSLLQLPSTFTPCTPMDSCSHVIASQDDEGEDDSDMPPGILPHAQLRRHQLLSMTVTPPFKRVTHSFQSRSLPANQCTSTAAFSASSSSNNSSSTTTTRWLRRCKSTTTATALAAFISSPATPAGRVAPHPLPPSVKVSAPASCFPPHQQWQQHDSPVTPATSPLPVSIALIRRPTGRPLRRVKRVWQTLNEMAPE